MEDIDRILTDKELSEDNVQKSLRPKTFNEYIGQKLLKENSLDDWTHNKTIQKIRESLRISKEEKEMLKTWKR